MNALISNVVHPVHLVICHAKFNVCIQNVHKSVEIHVINVLKNVFLSALILSAQKNATSYVTESLVNFPVQRSWIVDIHALASVVSHALLSAG